VVASASVATHETPASDEDKRHALSRTYVRIWFRDDRPRCRTALVLGALLDAHRRLMGIDELAEQLVDVLACVKR
jgi:hypothetical protein